MKNKLLTYIFITFITVAGLLSAVLPDRNVTLSERRYLYSFDELKDSGDISADFEKYSLDHFVTRDFLRKIKAFAEYNLFRKSDNNGLFEYKDFIIQQLYPLDETSIERLAEKINKITDLYANGNNIYYSMIPDKNYFTKDDNLRIDYQRMSDLLRNGIDENIKYINLFDTLALQDYYKTDHHFRIDGLSGVLDALGRAMKVDLSFDENKYTLSSYFPFYGAYYGHAAMNIDADTLLYLENSDLKNCVVKVWESFDSYSEFTGVYDFDKLGSMDSYDFFLYGTKPVVTIENPNSNGNRELVIFKDSFANSLTPLMLNAYSKVTLIDLRLVNHAFLEDLVDFNGADILFLYSTMVVNNSYILK